MTSDCTIVTSGHNSNIRTTFISINSITQKTCNRKYIWMMGSNWPIAGTAQLWYVSRLHTMGLPEKIRLHVSVRKFSRICSICYNDFKYIIHALRTYRCIAQVGDRAILFPTIRTIPHVNIPATTLLVHVFLLTFHYTGWDRVVCVIV